MTANKEPVKIKYVYIPADDQRPIQELTYCGDVPELGNDAFSENLKKFFGTGNMPATGGSLGDQGEGANSTVDREMLVQNLKGHLKDDEKNQVDQLPQDVLEKMMASTQLDIFPILLPTKEVEYTSVSVYVDDKGASKKYRENTRLTQMAHAIGYSTQMFLGDGFIGRIVDSEELDIWKRIDFGIEEFSSDASWVKTAKAHYKTKGAEVEKFKNLSASGGGGANDNSMNGRKYWSFTARDGGEEMELTFSPAVVDKKKVVVAFKNKSLYVEYEGKELFGQHSARIAQQRKESSEGNNNSDSGCMIEEVDEEGTPLADANKDANLFELPRDPKKTGAVLWDTVGVDECTWTIVDQTLQVTLCKKNDAKWMGVLSSEK